MAARDALVAQKKPQKTTLKWIDSVANVGFSAALIDA